ncbi:hypothetical protein Scep_017703 [Stephania cephalantha]|uniref:J domain-containing protein n=1 Tax=Stephania cephalantha TaxID=152367 RepID=A0AAP0IQY4_9MAGN
MPGISPKSEKNDAAKPQRRDPYEVLGVSRNSADQEIKSAYRKMALNFKWDSKLKSIPFDCDVFVPFIAFLYVPLKVTALLLIPSYFWSNEWHLLPEPLACVNIISWNLIGIICTSMEYMLAYLYHPDKNANDPTAADMFKEVTFSYNILSDPEKRRQYDTAGFEAIESESQELELDLSSLGAVNTMFAALFSKLGVPIKTTVSATVLEEALNGTVTVQSLELGQPLFRKVEKQCAHFYSVTITEQEAQSGLVCRVQSPDKSKFKLLYFEQEENGGLSLALQLVQDYVLVPSGDAFDFQKKRCTHLSYELCPSLGEESVKTGKFTSAGMYFLGFPVYRLDQALNSVAAAKDPDAAFFKKLDGFQPCEITELKAGNHVFSVYGDNFFKSASYSIEVLCAAPFAEEKDKLKEVEAQILSKRAELSKFESEYREVLTQFTEMTNRYAQEMQTIDDLLKERNAIHASYSTAPPLKRSSSSSKIRGSFKEKDSRKEENDSKKEEERPANRKKHTPMKDKTKRKKWYNIHLKVDRTKPC